MIDDEKIRRMLAAFNRVDPFGFNQKDLLGYVPWLHRFLARIEAEVYHLPEITKGRVLAHLGQSVGCDTLADAVLIRVARLADELLPILRPNRS